MNTWLLPAESNIELIFKDFDIDFEAGLRLNENGYLDPVVYGTDIHFGESTVTYDDWFIEFILFHLIKFVELSIENSSYVLGEYMFTNLLGPVLDAALNHYHIPLWFKAVVPGQTGSAAFDIDYRQVWSPLINPDGYADFRFSGEFIY